jgi:multidrug transporter EmrE-like cation transporter
MWIFPLSLLIVFEVVADIFAKEWSLKDKPIFWICSILAYIIANTFWLFAIKNGSGLARGATIFSVASAIIAILIGLVFYKESVTTIQFIGMIVGLIAIILIFWNDLISI